jgi:hypothetical protein
MLAITYTKITKIKVAEWGTQKKRKKKYLTDRQTYILRKNREKYTQKETNVQANKHINRQTERQKQKDKLTRLPLQWQSLLHHDSTFQTGKHLRRQKDRKKDRKTERQKDRKTERKTERQTNKQTDKQTHPSSPPVAIPAPS